jgi:SM-20-related protein
LNAHQWKLATFAGIFLICLKKNHNDLSIQVDEWCDQLAEKEFVVIDEILPREVYDAISSFFRSKLVDNDFDKAGIGVLHTHHIDEGIRGDFVYWLEKNKDQEMNHFFEFAEALRQYFNRNLMLSLSDYEFHLAHYPPGAFYKEHLDQFKGRDNRLLSLIIYFNDHWCEGDGGELSIIKPNSKNIIIQPIANRGVIFKSDSILHEVLATHKRRYSLTGWFLYRPVGIGFL